MPPKLPRWQAQLCQFSKGRFPSRNSLIVALITPFVLSWRMYFHVVARVAKQSLALLRRLPCAARSTVYLSRGHSKDWVICRDLLDLFDWRIHIHSHMRTRARCCM